MEKKKNSKKYKTILLDPPWDVNQRGRLGAEKHYDLMTLDQIRKLPVGELAEENAHCWLWVTNNTLRGGYDILEGWGFQPKSIFTWVKPRLGLGNFLRNCTEHMFLGVKGKLPVQFKGQMNWGFFPLQDHSHKPEEVHKVIERVSPGPYLEMFARRPMPGWDIWGNEVESDVVVPGYPVPKYNDKAGAGKEKEE